MRFLGRLGLYLSSYYKCGIWNSSRANNIISRFVYCVYLIHLYPLISWACIWAFAYNTRSYPQALVYNFSDAWSWEHIMWMRLKYRTLHYIIIITCMYVCTDFKQILVSDSSNNVQLNSCVMHDVLLCVLLSLLPFSPFSNFF